MTINLLLVYALFFAGALIFSLLINGIMLKFARTLGIRNTTDTIIRWSSSSKPALGGISFYILFLFSVIIFSFIKDHHINFFNLQTLGILSAVSIGFLLGLFDDAYNTHPWIKFFTQLLCGIVLIVTGTYIQIFEWDILNYLLTIFWVIGIMNSINMLDNMDGITTIVSFFILLSILLSLFLQGDFLNPLVVIIMGSLAALLGFLRYNWNPSRMYMGDTGSQFLGILLAGLAIEFFWNGTGITGIKNPLMQFVSVAIVFALPIIDTTTVSIKRIARGQSPFVGGRDHTTHHLSYLGLSDRGVAITFAMISLVSLGLSLFITNYIEVWTTTHLVGFSAYFLVLFVTLFVIANKNKDRN